MQKKQHTALLLIVPVLLTLLSTASVVWATETGTASPSSAETVLAETLPNGTPSPDILPPTADSEAAVPAETSLTESEVEAKPEQRPCRKARPSVKEENGCRKRLPSQKPEILPQETVAENLSPTAPSSPTTAVSDAPVLLSQEEAIVLALTDAALSRDAVKGLTVETEKENGRWIYEIEFRYNRTEYEFEIDAENGTLLEREIEIDD